MLFQDRFEAGRLLASKLSHLANRPHTVVLALPRGGVPVGFEVAKALNVPMDVFVVRKLGVPGYEELAMGAIASGGIRVLNEDLVRTAGIPEEVIDAVAAEEERELERRDHLARVVAVDQQTVDLPRLQPRISERERDRLGREVGRAAAVHLSYLGDP